MAIHLEATFPVPPEQVYELLVNGAKFGAVTGRPAKGGGSAGAWFTLFDNWVEGRQIELVPDQRIVQAWRFGDWAPGIYSIVRLTLVPEGTGTRMVVDHHGYPADMHEHLSTNWAPFYFEPFTKHFAGNPAGVSA